MELEGYANVVLTVSTIVLLEGKAGVSVVRPTISNADRLTSFPMDSTNLRAQERNILHQVGLLQGRFWLTGDFIPG